MKEQAWPETRTVPCVLRNGHLGNQPMWTSNPADGPPAQRVTIGATGASDNLETAPLAAATRFAGTIRLVMPVAFASEVTNLKAYLYVDEQKVTWGWANARFRDGFEKAEALTMGTEYTVRLDMMPRDFTVLPGSRMSIRIEGYGADWFVDEAQTISIDLAHTTLEMPLVPKARVEAATQLD